MGREEWRGPPDPQLTAASLQADEQAAAQRGAEDQPLGSELAPGRRELPPAAAEPPRFPPGPDRSVPPPQLENLSNFIKAMASYGMNPVDLFEANDLFESGNLTQVQVSLLALAGMVRARGRGTGRGHCGYGPRGGGPGPPPPSFLASFPRQAKTKGMQSGVDIGVKYSEKQQRNFDEAKMKAGQCVIGLQVGCPRAMASPRCPPARPGGVPRCPLCPPHGGTGTGTGPPGGRARLSPSPFCTRWAPTSAPASRA